MAGKEVYAICGTNCRYPTLTKEQIYEAIAEFAKTGTFPDVNTGFITTIKTINGVGLKFFVGPQAAYNALTDDEKKNLFAIISDDTTKETLLSTLETLRSELEGLKNNLSDGSFVVKEAEVATAKKNRVTVSNSISFNVGDYVEAGDVPAGRTIADLIGIQARLERSVVQGLFIVEHSENELLANCSGCYAASGSLSNVAAFARADIMAKIEDGKIYLKFLSLGEMTFSSTGISEYSYKKTADATDAVDVKMIFV